MSSDDFALLDDSDLRLPEDAVDERFAELFEKQNATVRTINEDLEAVVIRQLDEYFAQLEAEPRTHFTIWSCTLWNVRSSNTPCRCATATSARPPSYLALTGTLCAKSFSNTECCRREAVPNRRKSELCASKHF